VTWVTWQQHRLQVALGGGLLLLVAAIVLVSGVPMHAAFNSGDLPACLAQGGLDQGCLALRGSFRNQHQDLESVLVGVVSALPLLAGVFVGAPLLGREFETGTHRLAWTQTITRLRWAGVKVGLLVSGVVVMWVAITLLMVWWLQPLDAVRRGSFTSFEVEGFAPVAYALFAFGLGVACGAAIRRTIPAMAVTLVVFEAIRYGVATYLRPYYQQPLLDTWDPVQGSTRDNLGDWAFGGYGIDRSGQPMTQAQLDELYHQFRLTGDKEGILQYLHDQGVRFADLYQPADRFWTFQAIEAAIFVVLALAVLCFALWWVRKRPA
jgi:hypothetical protein